MMTGLPCGAAVFVSNEMNYEGGALIKFWNTSRLNMLCLDDVYSHNLMASPKSTVLLFLVEL